ncbi:MAG TPA: hypothetical protein VJH23_05930 [archaeon]|nr:hypothetical protein [archaeon]
MAQPSKPLIAQELWEKAFSMNEHMREALINPNTDFMTKLLFDARFFEKKLGKDVAYWSNAIFALKMLLHEKKAVAGAEIAKQTGMSENEAKELISYLKNMSEILEEKGKYSLNYVNLFSKMFKE